MIVPGETSITPDMIQKVAPDVAAPKGQSELSARMVGASRIKGMFESALGIAAKNLGGTSSVRVKDPATAQKKIVQKRMEGRDYGVDNLNDLIGGRIVINKESDLPKAKKEIIEMEKAGLFKIKKQEVVRSGNYDAFHSDLVFPDGTKGELQIHTPQSEAESIVNHDQRAIHGEKLPDPVKKLTDIQASIAERLPNNKARLVSQALQSLHKQNNNQPIHPAITAAVLRSAEKGG